MAKDNHTVTVKRHTATAYSAPIPPPSMLKEYYELKPEYADSIFKMAEENNTASIKISNKAMDGNIRHKSRGQWLAFIIVVIGYAMAAMFAFILKNTPAAITSIISGTLPLAIAGVQGLLK